VTRAQGGEGGYKDGTQPSSGGGGAANLGGGGFGISNLLVVDYGGTGGSGVVIIAYPSSFTAIKTIDVGLTYSVSTTSRSGYRVYTFTAGTGNIKF